MTVRIPQLFKSAEIYEIDRFVADPDWVLEQKVDGMRMLTVVKPHSIEFYTRGGNLLKSAAAKLHFDTIRAELGVLQAAMFNQDQPDFEFVFDGEIMTDVGEYVLFDLPYFRVGTVAQTPSRWLAMRRQSLAQIFWRGLGDHIKLVTYADTTESKLKLVALVKAMGGEGLIAKRKDSPYNEGERVKHSLKLKFTSTADVIVMAKNSGESKHSIRGGDKINFEFGVRVIRTQAEIDGGVPENWTRHVGNCSGIGKEFADVGDVIEVEYLYVGAGGKLVQPRMVRARPDKKASECTVEQFKTYSKAVI